MKNVVDLLGRILLSFIFLYDAYDSIFYFKDTKAKLTSYGLLWKQDWLIVGAIIFLVLGGLMLLFGYRPKLGAVLLLLYWIPVTFIVHAYWEYEEPILPLWALYYWFGQMVPENSASGAFWQRRAYRAPKFFFPLNLLLFVISVFYKG